MKGAKKSTKSATKASSKQAIKPQTKPKKKPQNKNPAKLIPSQEKSVASMNHVDINEMVMKAISTLQGKKGCNLKNITNFILTTYKVDVGKHGMYIKKYINSALANETIVKVKSNRSSGKFMIVEDKVTLNGNIPPKKTSKRDIQKSEKKEVQANTKKTENKTKKVEKKAVVKRPAVEVKNQQPVTKKRQKTANEKQHAIAVPQQSKNSKKTKAIPVNKPASKSKGKRQKK